MSDDVETHTHDGSDIPFATPDQIGQYNLLQQQSLAVLLRIIKGVYHVGIDGEDRTKVRLLDFTTNRMIDGVLEDDGDITWELGRMPTLIFGLSALEHPGLMPGEGHHDYHTGVEILLDQFTNGDMPLTMVVDTARNLAKHFGLIPQNADEIDAPTH